MHEMKDSEALLGKDLPSKWTVSKIKYVSQFQPSCQLHGITAQSIVTYTPMECVKNGYTINRTAEYSLIPSSLTSFEEGDIVMAKVTPCFENGNIAVMSDLASGIGFGSSELFVFRASRINTRFLFYWLQSSEFVEKAKASMTGMGGLKRVSPQYIQNAIIMYPDTSEQYHITDFLDTKCAELSSLVADIQSQIDALEQYKRSVITEMVTKGLNPDADKKDSNVRWIGQMPAHWECIRGKYILRYLQKPIREDDGVITCFRDGEVTLRSNRREDGFTMSDKEIGYQGIDVGDLVVHGMDGFAGAIGISDSRGKASPVLNVLDTKQNKRYVMYYLRSMAYSDVFVAMATGIRVRSCDLRWNKLSELQYPVPPVDEQEKIVNHIDAVLQRTNDVIADKQSQLATLDEYKKSLIYEYVTGKKEVGA